MHLRNIALGFLALGLFACGDKTAFEVTSGRSSGGGSQGAPYSLASNGRLAKYPLAVGPDGSAWLLGGTYLEQASGAPGIWEESWIIKLDPYGNVLSTGFIKSPGIEVEPIAVKTDPEGNVLIAAHAKVIGEWVPNPKLGIVGTDFDTSMDASVLVRLDPNGDLLWASAGDTQQTPSDPPAFRFADIGSNADGEVYTLAWIASPFVSDATDSIVTIQGSENGMYQYQHTLPAMNTVHRKLEVEPSGTFWVARSSYDQDVNIRKYAEWGKVRLDFTASVCGVDAFAFAPDGNGGFFMARAENAAKSCHASIQHHSLGASSDWLVEGKTFQAVHPTLTQSTPGRVWLSLGLQGSIQTQSSSLIGTDASDIMITEIDEQGNFLQSQTYGGPGDDHVVQIAVDNAGHRYIAGYFETQIDFGQGIRSNDTGEKQAIFVTRLDP